MLSFIDLNGLNHFYEKIKLLFANIIHTHTVSDITDYTVDSSLSSTSENPVQNKVVNSALNEKVPTSRTVNGKSLNSNITLSASDVGADASGSANTAESNAKSYTNQQVSNYLPLSGGTITGNLSGTTISTTGAINCGAGFNVNKKADGTIGSSSLEIFHKSSPYIDFHYGGTTSDYTSRVIESSNGTLAINGVKCTSGGILEVPNTASFNGGIHLPNAIAINGKDANGNNVEMMRVGGDTNEAIVILGDSLYVNGEGRTNLCGGTQIALLTSQERVYLENSTDPTYTGHFRPNNDNKCTLGTSARRFHTVYAGKSAIQTSDAREKENIIPIGTSPIMTLALDEPTEQIDLHSELFDRLQPMQYNFINDNRMHFGLVAQQVVSAMEELGMQENDLDLVHHDYWTDEETGEQKDRYGIAYNNLITLLIHEVQKLKAESTSLKEEIDLLKEKINY